MKFQRTVVVNEHLVVRKKKTARGPFDPSIFKSEVVTLRLNFNLARASACNTHGNAFVRLS